MTRSSDAEQPRAAASIADIVASALLWVVQAIVGVLSVPAAAITVMGTSNCSTFEGDGYASCGGDGWIRAAVWTGGISATILLIACSYVIVRRLRAGHRASPMAALFCVAQLVMIPIVMVIGAQSGPV
ncbi:hypothetical protein QSJ18_14875 [Gordonia sp. ABSL1-1]|uniref:hypothetical protein n=1 Tax=Gordonia sp. ABSL1-1 TaxID=3053923 RepID=UPI002572431E|nr:hypothetical protein [Gordonia sp. ABSL1-1]MDL9938034.1 hypothetical protein [Gordonia sp. ABSL1-1]